MTGGFSESLKREKSDLLACSFRARAADESKSKPEEPEDEDGFETDFEELLLLLPLSEPEENFVPDPEE
jgi:hypothetical protein